MAPVPIDLSKIDFKRLIRKNVPGNGPFLGVRYQRGGQRGSGLGGILTSAISALPSFLNSFLGQQLTHSGNQVINDIASGESPISSLKKRGRAVIKNVTGLGPRKRIKANVKVLKPPFVKSRRTEFLNA